MSGITRETARQWAAAHDIGRKVGGRWKISRAALLMFLDGNRGALRAYLAGDRTSLVTRYDRRPDNLLAALKLATVRIWINAL